MLKICGYLIAASLSLGVVACNPGVSTSPVGNGASPVPVVVDTPQAGVNLAKAMFAAEALYNVPAFAYVKADTAGQLSPEVKAKVKPLLVKGYDALKGVRAAYAVGNAVEFQVSYDSLKKLTDSATELLPPS